MYNETTMLLKNAAFGILVALMGVGSAFSQSDLPAPSPSQETPSIPIEEVIRKFSEREKAFKLARENYVYRQDVKLQELNANDRVTGEYHTSVTSFSTLRAAGPSAWCLRLRPL